MYTVKPKDGIQFFETVSDVVDSRDTADKTYWCPKCNATLFTSVEDARNFFKGKEYRLYRSNREIRELAKERRAVSPKCFECNHLEERHGKQMHIPAGMSCTVRGCKCIQYKVGPSQEMVV